MTITTDQLKPIIAKSPVPCSYAQLGAELERRGLSPEEVDEEDYGFLCAEAASTAA